MKPTVSQYAQAFLDLYEAAPATERPGVSEGFFELLKRRRETKKMPAILRQIERLVEEKSGVKRVQVVSARALDKGELEEVARRAKEIFGTGEVSLETKVDPSAKGGVVLRTGTERADLSAAAKVRELRKVLLQ
jgi:F0F1-type ATP synthase delta subunit